MKKRQSVLFFVAMIFVAGCTDQILTDQNKTLKAEAENLRAALDHQFAQVEYANSQASLAAGCDWLIPTCPASAVASGRKFLAGGYGGGGWSMWAIFILKIASLAALAGVSVASGAWMWARTGRPAAKAIAAAQALIDEAENRRKTGENRADEALKRQKTAESDENSAIIRKKLAEKAAQDAETRAEEAIAVADAAEIRTKTAAAIRASLSGFD